MSSLLLQYMHVIKDSDLTFKMFEHVIESPQKSVCVRLP